jgi:hypothetical protein
VIIAKIGPSAKPFTTVSDGEVAPEMGVMEMTMVLFLKEKEE